MKGTDVYRVLQQIRATHLHHANSVITSCTFLEQGGLLSREFVEKNGLTQTSQSSDKQDKKMDIWNRIFVDHVDIHDRGGRKKGPNQYGPVLFVLDLDILLNLPSGTDVVLTKKNPIYWTEKEPDADKWFQSAEELAKNIHFGDFDKMLMIHTPSGKLPFPKKRVEIILDDPQRKFSSGQDAYEHARKRLTAAAKKGRIEANIERRDCQTGCICLKKYSAYDAGALDLYFA